MEVSPLTKKDYTLIASVINLYTDAQITPILHKYSRSIAITFANALEKDNPRFDREKFLQMCLKGDQR